MDQDNLLSSGADVPDDVVDSTVDVESVAGSGGDDDDDDLEETQALEVSVAKVDLPDSEEEDDIEASRVTQPISGLTIEESDEDLDLLPTQAISQWNRFEGEEESDLQDTQPISRVDRSSCEKLNTEREDISGTDQFQETGEVEDEGLEVMEGEEDDLRALSRSVSKSPSRSRSSSVQSSTGARSRSASDTGLRSRSNSADANATRSRSQSYSSQKVRSRSVTRSKSRSESGSKSRSVSRSVSRSRSRSMSAVSRSRSRSETRRMSRSKSRSLSGSRSRSRSRSMPRREGTGAMKRLFDSDEDSINDDSDEDRERKREERCERKSPEKEKEDDSDDDIRRENEGEGGSGNDFDMMMQRKRAENRTRRTKRKDIDVINDNDDAIAKMIADMRIAAKEDRELNILGKPATKKMGMFKNVLHNLNKAELQMAFVEANLLSVMTDWLAPMPDKSLPHLVIRTEFLKLLHSLKMDDTSRLKESGIGKAVMYLYRHPKEERRNKHIAGQIINEWARPIFRKNTDFSNMTKEERRSKDADMAARLGRRKRQKTDEDTEEPIKPGAPGWVGRARVPMVDNSEYVNRPQWQTTVQVTESKKKTGMNLLEKHKRAFAERKRLNKNQSLVKISLEGNRMKEF